MAKGKSSNKQDGKKVAGKSLKEKRADKKVKRNEKEARDRNAWS